MTLETVATVVCVIGFFFMCLLQALAEIRMKLERKRQLDRIEVAHAPKREGS